MKFEYYFPTFRGVLLHELEVAPTKAGIILPSAYIKDDGKLYQVLKVGKDCSEVQEGDVVRLTKGIHMDEIKLTHLLSVPSSTDKGMDPDSEHTCFQVMEQQIIGYFRVKKQT